MGYRDDVYHAENIIGYTGKPNSNPSVYFQKGNSFGHITQFHAIPFNIGRETVDTSDSYSIGNEMINGELRSVEKKDGDAFHTSRSPFVPIADVSADEKALLTQSITRFSDEKEIGTMNDAMRNQVLNKLDVLDEINPL